MPTLMLTGANDGCMDIRLYDYAVDPKDFPAGMEVVRFQGAGHFLHQELPGRVNQKIYHWLEKYN